MNTNDNQDLAEEEEEEQYEERLDFYQIIKRLREEGDNNPVSRLLYVAYFNESLVQSQNVELDKVMEQRVKKEIQGYCLIKGAFQIHMLEGDSSAINEFMLQLYNDFNREKSVYLNLNVIAFSEENSTKMFARWYCENIY